MADLGGEPLDRRGDQRQGHKELRVAVARDHLGGDRLGLEAEFLRNMGLDPWIYIGEGPDRTGDRASPSFLSGGEEPHPIAGELRVVSCELEAEGGRLRMDAVAAPDRRRVFVLDSAPLEYRQQSVEIGK